MRRSVKFKKISFKRAVHARPASLGTIAWVLPLRLTCFRQLRHYGANQNPYVTLSFA
jgi:hypothetical protein